RKDWHFGASRAVVWLAQRGANGLVRDPAPPAMGLLRVSFPKIISGHTDDVGQPERGLRRPCQSVESAVRAGNLYSKPDAYAFDCSTRHRRREFSAGVPHRR